MKSTLKRESKRPRNRWEGSARRRAVSAVELSMACLHLGCRGACSGESSRLRSEKRRQQESCGAACALSTRTHQRGSPRAHKSGGVGGPAEPRHFWELIARRLGCGRGPSVDRGVLRALFAGEARSATGSVCSPVGRDPTLASSRCRATRLETRTKECRRRASLWVKETRRGRSESETREPALAVGAPWTEPCGHAVAGFESERTCCDPKDGELCPRRVKPGETLVEARSGSDVQIDRRTWV